MVCLRLPDLRKRLYNAAKANTKPRMKRLLLATLLGLALLAGHSIPAQEEPKYTRTEDVIYERKFGTALTLDVFEPEKKNGAAIFFMVSGGFFSDHKNINPSFYRSLLEHGYTVFAIVHGSQPRFIIPEIEQDIHRAIRFVRHNARRWGVDTDRKSVV